MFWENLIRLCERKGTSPTALCAELGLSNSAAVRWKKGSIPQDRTLAKIADYFGVDPESLTSQTDSKNNTVNIIHGSDGLSRLPLQLVPVFESVSAGFGSLARNEVVEYVPCFFNTNKETDETIGIKVHGDSMYPKIEDGDIVIVHKQESIDSGMLGVVIIDGDEGYVKRVEYGKDWICLHSINPMYPVMKFKNEEVLRVQVVGRVTKIIKDV